MYFFADDDQRDRYFSSTPRLPIRNNMTLDTKNMDDPLRGNTNKAAKRRLTRQKKFNRDQRVELELSCSSTTTDVKDNSSSSSSVPVDQDRKNNDHQDPSWPHFEDEDYIVFCFKEDGAFDVMKDSCIKPEAASNCIDCKARSSSRPVNRQVSNIENSSPVLCFFLFP